MVDVNNVIRRNYSSPRFSFLVSLALYYRRRRTVIRFIVARFVPALRKIMSMMIVVVVVVVVLVVVLVVLVVVVVVVVVVIIIKIIITIMAIRR